MPSDISDTKCHQSYHSTCFMGRKPTAAAHEGSFVLHTPQAACTSTTHRHTAHRNPTCRRRRQATAAALLPPQTWQRRSSDRQDPADALHPLAEPMLLLPSGSSGRALLLPSGSGGRAPPPPSATAAPVFVLWLQNSSAPSASTRSA